MPAQDVQRFGADDDSGRDAAHAVTQAARQLVGQTQQYTDQVGHEAGLNRTDLAALNQIDLAAATGERLGPGEVACRLSLSAAAVTALVDRLERVGHLVRDRDEVDKRRVRLDVTRHAVDTSKVMFDPMVAAMAESIEHYSEAQLQLLAEMLGELTAAVAQAQGERPTLSAHETG